MTEIIDPESIEFHCADGVFIKTIGVVPAGAVIPQHSHVHAHNTLIARGSVRAWCDGKLMGDFKAPNVIYIRANAKHTFQTLEADTLLCCVHNIMRTGDVEIAEIHELERF